MVALVCGEVVGVARYDRSPTDPGEAEFAVLRDYCQVSDSTLSKTLTALEKAGYVGIRKGYLGKRPRTWAALMRGRLARRDRRTRAATFEWTTRRIGPHP